MAKEPVIKTILVPTDGSDHAEKAVRFAGDLAARYGARVVVQHVLMRGHIPERVLTRLTPATDALPRVAAVPMAIGGFADPGPTLAEREALGREIIRLAREVAIGEGCKAVEVAFHDGDPVECILATAEAERADVIVMGSRGLSDLQGLLLGSVSHKVSHLAPCTCVTVR